MFPTDLENIFEKKEIPVVPPGTLAITVQRSEIICPMAHSTVSGVLCKCKAQYSVAISVPPYVVVSRSLSLENICFKYANGPHKNKKLKEVIYKDLSTNCCNKNYNTQCISAVNTYTGCLKKVDLTNLYQVKWLGIDDKLVTYVGKQ